MRSSVLLVLTSAALGAPLCAQRQLVAPSAPSAPAAQSVHEAPRPALENVHGAAPTPVDVDLDDALPLPGDGVVGEDGVVSKGSGDPCFLGFVGGSYFPPAGERVDPLLVSQVDLAGADGRPAPASYAFVMFSKRITPARQAALERLGCRVLGFHPGYCLKVALPPQRIDEVAALDFVRWIGAPRAEQKVHPDLAQRAAAARDGEQLAMLVSVYESDLCAASTRDRLASGEQLDRESRVSAGVDERNAAWLVHSNGWQQRALERLGFSVDSYTEKDSVRAFHVRAPAAAIGLLGALDFVQFVESELLATPFHDESMALVQSDAVRTQVTGGSSSSVVCGEIDSGIATGHSDLYYHLNGWGWDFSGAGTGAWTDACGHGTHVAGTITGDGTSNAALRGGAPGLGWGATGRFQNARIFATCASQSVNLASVMGVMRSGSWDNGGSFTPRSHVINNSWGSGGGAWIGSEYQSRLIDDEVYWQRQMYVFAAGNDSNASTVSQEAGAKNAFAVGSVDDYVAAWTSPGARSSFSSQGPMGDTRWKPNVCAPGDTIRSLRANTWDQYTSLSGTSMAAPHVTGIAAQLCDHYAWLRYSPAGLASVMMASAVTRNSAPITNQYASGLNQYGAGRTDAWLANYGSGQTGWTNWTFDLGAGQGTSADFYVNPGTTRVVVCMTWNEQACSAGASKAAINDWDLYIDQDPFTPGFNTGEYTAGLSSFNNTEIRYIDNPPAGWFRWKLHPYNATTPGEFGVTVFFVSGPLNPTVGLTLSPSTYYTQPWTPVQISAAVYNPGYLASAAVVSSFGGSYVNAAYKWLNDGAYCDMSGNMTGGRSMTLGDVLSYNTRTAYWDAVWGYEGLNPFQVNAGSDNGPIVSQTVWVAVDGTPPSAVPWAVSPTHTPGRFGCDNTLVVDWGASTDNVSGVYGYSYEWDQSPGTIPDTLVDTWLQSASIWAPDSFAPYYFHVRAIDYCGNAGASVDAGPYYVMSTAGWSYCGGKINSQFCLPAMGSTGRLSMSGADDLHLYGSQVINQQNGVLFWGHAPASAPFQGGLKCVANPVVRSPVLNSGGAPVGTDCSGVFDFAFTRSYAVLNGLSAGDVVYTQFWYRDPPDPDHTGLTDATAIVVCD